MHASPQALIRFLADGPPTHRTLAHDAAAPDCAASVRDRQAVVRVEFDDLERADARGRERAGGGVPRRQKRVAASPFATGPRLLLPSAADGASGAPARV